MSAPTCRYLSPGAGIQNSTVLLLAVRGEIPTFDAAIFADTGWEPAPVYGHLRRLEQLAAPSGIQIVRVSAGDLRRDALDPAHRFASMPLFTLGPGGERGMARRQGTSEYKIKPIKAEESSPGSSYPQPVGEPWVRRHLGYPHPARVPAGVVAEIATGIILDEIGRARDADVAYMHNALLDLGWRREDCQVYLTAHGLAGIPRSACVGCPYRTDAEWARLRRDDPDGWADAVAFDAAIRHGAARANAAGQPLRGQFFLHCQRVPLDQVTLRPRADAEADVPGCGPWTCPHAGPSVDAAFDAAATPGWEVRD